MWWNSSKSYTLHFGRSCFRKWDICSIHLSASTMLHWDSAPVVTKLVAFFPSSLAWSSQELEWDSRVLIPAPWSLRRKWGNIPSSNRPAVIPLYFFSFYFTSESIEFFFLKKRNNQATPVGERQLVVMLDYKFSKCYLRTYVNIWNGMEKSKKNQSGFLFKFDQQVHFEEIEA